MKRIAPLLSLSTAVFRTYCDETQQVDISNFLPFGNGDWTSETTGNFIDLGDKLISEGDDLITPMYAGNSRHEFGNERRYRLCISSNGPIYFERLTSACQAKEGDFLPLPFQSSDPSNEWDGIAAVWADLVPFHESNRNGGNIYYRRVDKGNSTAQGISDMATAASILPPTDKVIENLHIVTYHKMAESNSKRDCDIGASWQYVIAFYKDEYNPSVTINYGIQGWDMPNVIAGWNMNYLPQNSDLRFSDFVGQGTKSLDASSIACDGYHCSVMCGPFIKIYNPETGLYSCMRQNDDPSLSTITFMVQWSGNVEWSGNVDCADPPTFPNTVMTSCTGGVATYETTFDVLAPVESESDVNDALSGINYQDLYDQIEAQFNALQYTTDIQPVAPGTNSYSAPTVTITCGVGYEKVQTNDGEYCQNINECLDAGSFSCPALSTCQDTIGSYICNCNAGYEMVNNQCEDYNECNDFPCPESTPVCTNTIGSYTCEAGSVPPGPNPGGEEEDWEVVDNLEHDNSDLTLIEYSLYNQGVFEVEVNGEILEYKKRRKRQAPVSTTVSVNYLVDQVLPLYGCQCTKLFADNILGSEMGHTDSVDSLCQQKSRCLHCAQQKPECENSAYDWIAIYDYDLNSFICDEFDPCNQEMCQCAVDFANSMVSKITAGLVNVHDYYDLMDTDLCVKSQTGGPGCGA